MRGSGIGARGGWTGRRRQAGFAGNSAMGLCVYKRWLGQVFESSTGIDGAEARSSRTAIPCRGSIALRTRGLRKMQRVWQSNLSKIAFLISGSLLCYISAAIS